MDFTVDQIQNVEVENGVAKVTVIVPETSKQIDVNIKDVELMITNEIKRRDNLQDQINASNSEILRLQSILSTLNS